MGKKKNENNEEKKEIEESLKNFENGTDEFGATMEMTSAIEKDEIEKAAKEEHDEVVATTIKEEKNEPKVEEKEETEVKEEPVVEPKRELTPEPKKRPKKKFGALIAILLIILLALGIALGFLIGKSVFDKEENKKEEKPQEEQKQDEPNKEEQPKEDEPKKEDKPQTDEDYEIDYIDLKVKNINSSKDYKIQLVRKYDKNHHEYEDGYTYAFYDKTNGRMITDFNYRNVTCGGNICAKEPDEIGCIEKNIKVFSVKTGPFDYIYGTYDTNVCGGIDSNHFLYNLSNYETKEGMGGRSDVYLRNDRVVIRYSTAGDDICPVQGVEQLECNGEAGYTFDYGGFFDTIKGKAAFQYDKLFAIVDYNYKVSPNFFAISLIDEFAVTKDIIRNCIAYNEKYVAVVEGKDIVIKELNGNKVGVVDSIKYDENYFYGPNLREENGKLILSYGLKPDGNPKDVSINLK